MASLPPDADARVARWLLGALVALLLLGAILAPWHSAWTVDDRTYIEMTRGVVLHGLPYLDNGPAALTPALVARWNNLSNGHLWGTYTPGYPYLMAPLLSLGGVSLGVRWNYLALALAALCLSRLGARATGSRVGGALTAWLAVAATPALGMSPVFSPYTTVVLGVAGSLCFVDAALESTGRRALFVSAAAGAAASLTLLLNPVSAAVAAAALGALAHGPALSLARYDAASVGAAARRGAALLGAALLGAAPLLLAASALNHHRFGVWSPIAAGSCAWPSIAALCRGGGPIGYSAGALLGAAVPVVAWVACLTAAVVCLRGRPRIALAAAIALAAVAVEPLRARLLGMGSLLLAYTVDPGHSLQASSFIEAPDGLGRLSGPAVVKALLQSAPALALALAAWPSDPRRRVLFAACAVTAAAHMVFLSARYAMPGEHALGWPFAHLRYNLPAVAPLCVLAAMGASTLALRRAHLLTALGVALALGAWLAAEPHDLAFLRRFVLLRGTLLVAGLTLVVTAAARRGWSPAAKPLAPALAAAALGLSAAINVGGDLVVFARLRGLADDLTDRVAAAAPARFALVGAGSSIDPVLALRASRDVEYLDLNEVRSPAEFLVVTRAWAASTRSTFALGPPSLARALSGGGFAVTPIDLPSGLYRIEPPPQETTER